MLKTPIYLDYNATTPIDKEVALTMIEIINSHYGNPSSTYTMGKQSKSIVDNARKQVAALINANADEIFFTSCATESNNLAIRGVAHANSHKGKHIITSQIEHPAVIEVCRSLEQAGFEVSYLPVEKTGKIDVKELENAIRPDTILITIMHANNEVGTIQSIDEIGAIAKNHGITFHTDAAQSAGKVEIDVSKTKVDLLTIAGHKLYAPKGIGALYVRGGTSIKKIMYGANQEKGLRPGTENIIHIAALGKACEIAKRDFIINVSAMQMSRNLLLKKLTENTELELISDVSNCLPNTLSISFKNTDAQRLTEALKDLVCISTGSACHSGKVDISSVLKAMTVSAETAKGSVRISTGKNTSSEEVDFAAKHIIDTIKNNA